MPINIHFASSPRYKLAAEVFAGDKLAPEVTQATDVLTLASLALLLGAASQAGAASEALENWLRHHAVDVLGVVSPDGLTNEGVLVAW